MTSKITCKSHRFRQARQDYISDTTASEVNFDDDSLCKVSEFECSTNSKMDMPKTKSSNKRKRAILWLYQSGYITEKQKEFLLKTKKTTILAKKSSSESKLDFTIYNTKSILHLGEPSKPKVDSKKEQIDKLAKNLENFIKLVRLKRKLQVLSKVARDHEKNKPFVRIINRTVASENLAEFYKNCEVSSNFTIDNKEILQNYESILDEAEQLENYPKKINQCTNTAKPVSTQTEHKKKYANNVNSNSDMSTAVINAKKIVTKIPVKTKKSFTVLFKNDQCTQTTKTENNYLIKQTMSKTAKYSCTLSSVNVRKINNPGKVFNKYRKLYVKKCARALVSSGLQLQASKKNDNALGDFERSETCKSLSKVNAKAFDSVKAQLEDKYYTIRCDIVKYLNNISYNLDDKRSSFHDFSEEKRKLQKSNLQSLIVMKMDSSRRNYTNDWLSSCLYKNWSRH